MRIGQKKRIRVGGRTDENEYETQTHLLKTSLLFRSHGLIQKKIHEAQLNGYTIHRESRLLTCLPIHD